LSIRAKPTGFAQARQAGHLAGFVFCLPTGSSCSQPPHPGALLILTTMGAWAVKSYNNTKLSPTTPLFCKETPPPGTGKKSAQSGRPANRCLIDQPNQIATIQNIFVIFAD